MQAQQLSLRMSHAPGRARSRAGFADVRMPGGHFHQADLCCGEKGSKLRT